MASDARQYVIGPGDLYVAPGGSPAPSDDPTSAPPVAYVHLGYLEKPAEVTVKRTWLDKEPQQAQGTVAKFVTSTKVHIKTDLAQATLDNLLVALANQGTVTTVGNVRVFEPDFSLSFIAPIALILDGPAPQGGRRRTFASRAVSMADVTLTADRANTGFIAVEFELLYPEGGQPVRITEHIPGA